MAKDWEFRHAGDTVRIRNSIFNGAKLYVNGECKDQDNSIFATGRLPNLSASLPGGEILEVYLRSAFLSVEAKAVLRDGAYSTVIFDTESFSGIHA